MTRTWMAVASCCVLTLAACAGSDGSEATRAASDARQAQRDVRDEPRVRSSSSVPDEGPDPAVGAAFPTMADGYALAPADQVPQVDRAGDATGVAAFMLRRADCCDPGQEYRYPPSVIVRKYRAPGIDIDELEATRRADFTRTPGIIASTFTTRRLRRGRTTWVRMSWDLDTARLTTGQLPNLHAVTYSAVRSGYLLEFTWLCAAAQGDKVERDLLPVWRDADWDVLPAIEP